jgi:hypothetical protein
MGFPPLSPSSLSNAKPKPSRVSVGVSVFGYAQAASAGKNKAFMVEAPGNAASIEAKEDRAFLAPNAGRSHDAEGHAPRHARWRYRSESLSHDELKCPDDNAGLCRETNEHGVTMLAAVLQNRRRR